MKPSVATPVFVAEALFAFGHLVSSQHSVRNNGALD